MSGIHRPSFNEKTQFIYFFVAAGITLLLMNALNFLSQPKNTEGDYSRIAIEFVVGVTLCPVAGIRSISGILMLILTVDSMSVFDI
jgi:hypothetical protein